MLFSPVIAGGGPLLRCAPNCPANALHIGSDPRFAEVAGKAETYIALTLAAAVFVVYLVRLLRSSKPQRRALLAVAVTSLLLLPAWFVATFSAWILELDLQTLETMAWVIVAARILLPLGFLIALLQADHFAGRALRRPARAARRAGRRPSSGATRWPGARRPRAEARVQRAGDRRLPGAVRRPLTPAAVKSHQAWVAVDRDDEPVAAMVIDEALTADPELVRSAASATLLAVENGALEGELRASRARIVEAGHAERRRIERDLHDGAQQRLVALRMHLSLVGEQLGGSRELDSLGVEVDQAIHELRNLAHGVYPQLLAQAGVGTALMAVGRRSGMQVRVHEHGLSRHAEPVEITVYFCCVECLQNAAKHAGPGASVTVTLGESDGARRVLRRGRRRRLRSGERGARVRADEPGGPGGGGGRDAAHRLAPRSGDAGHRPRAGATAGGEPGLRLAAMASTAQRVVALAIAPMVAVTVWLALSSDHLERPAAAALYWGYLVAAPMAIGLYWRLRRPASRFGPLLVAYGILAWVVSWASSDWPPAFDVAGLAQPVFFAFTLYLLLAFPAGRLEPLAARRLFIAQIVAFLVVYPVLVLFSPVVPAGGAIAGCAPDCPENLLQIGSDSTLLEVTGKTGLAMTVAIVAGVIVLYVARLRAATRPRRRALMAVAVTSLLFLPVIAAFHLAFLLELDPGLVEALAWATAFAQVLVPLGFLIALVQAEAFAAGVLRTLLERLTARPTPDRWRDAIAGALADDSLRLAYYDPVTQTFRESDGCELARPAPGSGRAWVPVAGDVAAMVVDETLMEDPELVRAAASATLLAVQSGSLEGELRASSARIVEAGDAERRRIERDLHDGAQQRLVALRMHLALVGEKLGPSSAFDSLGVEVDEAIHELRDLAHGLYPPLLGQAGVGTALAALARRSGMPVRIDVNGLSRQSVPVESTVYFCCVECLQNAARHAGPGVSVTIGFADADGGLEFSVADDGAGFDPGSVQRGSGLTNLADRLAAVGGTLQIDSRPGDGTRITGRVPTG